MYNKQPVNVNNFMNSFKSWLTEQENTSPSQLYHVTMIRKLPMIKSRGILPDQRSAFTAGAYPAYSKGKVFLTDANGINYWKHKVEYAEFDQFDDTMGVAVITVNVAGLNLQRDEIGSTDSRSNSYFVTEAIPASRIVNIEEFPEE